MNTILTKLSDEKAAKEVTRFTFVGLALSAASLLLFWWLAIAGIALSVRGLALTLHKANKGVGSKYKALSILGIIIGLVSVSLYFATHS